MDDPSWYMSSDPTNYVTSNLNNMFFKNEYKGKGKLIISNDQNLSISHIEAIIIDSMHNLNFFFSTTFYMFPTLPRTYWVYHNLLKIM